jgi:hypothetical protein
LSACGGASTPAAGNDDASSQQVNIAVSTNPSPAMMGDMELVLMITDGDGNPIEGATVDVSADHTDMTGMTMSGATDQGGGKYCHQCQLQHERQLETDRLRPQGWFGLQGRY